MAMQKRSFEQLVVQGHKVVKTIRNYAAQKNELKVQKLNIRDVLFGKILSVGDLEEFKKLYITEVFALNCKDNVETLRAIIKDANHKVLTRKLLAKGEVCRPTCKYWTFCSELQRWRNGILRKMTIRPRFGKTK